MGKYDSLLKRDLDKNRRFNSEYTVKYFVVLSPIYSCANTLFIYLFLSPCAKEVAPGYCLKVLFVGLKFLPSLQHIWREGPKREDPY